MKKVDLVEKIASGCEITKRKAEMAVTTFTNEIVNALIRGEKVTLVGFGTFSIKKRAARKARNPRTGATISVPAKKVPRFQPGTKLRSRVK
ncbi:MAG: HU family DNA-binding protein [bacterium]|nr:HU family DNA-binding protein [bacterium]